MSSSTPSIILALSFQLCSLREKCCTYVGKKWVFTLLSKTTTGLIGYVLDWSSMFLWSSRAWPVAIFIFYFTQTINRQLSYPTLRFFYRNILMLMFFHHSLRNFYFAALVLPVLKKYLDKNGLFSSALGFFSTLTSYMATKISANFCLDSC